MGNLWVISDHHFGHSNILNFTKSDGSLLRPGFKDADHMAEVMIERHNAVVKPGDKCYFLGDFAMKDKGISYAGRMNGEKRLLLGNHDYGQNIKLYMPYFKAIYSTRLLDKVLMSHIPISQYSFGKALINAHGHIHQDSIDLDNRYFNCCVEALDYTPISFEDLKKKAFKRLES